MKKILTVVMCVTIILSLSACGMSIPDATKKETQYQEQLMEQSTNEIGMPDVTEFTEKKLAKEIVEKRDDSSLICYVYNQSYDGRYIFVGKSMGYGLPYSTQYTNPMQMKDDPNGSFDAGSSIIPQADPNGLYSSDGLSATWLMMIDEITGEPYIMYCEPTIIVTETKLPKRLIAEWSLTKSY